MANWTVGLGGTFDHFHAGHERLLQVAFDIGTKVVIGLASDSLLEHKQYKELLQSYEEREENLKAFARKIGRDADLIIIKLDDPFGPAITDPDIDMHVSSEETFSVAQEINEMRRQNGLKPLILVMIPMVLKDDDVRYSSTGIREELARND
ncbi:MAG TPA: pantetheine-phosphate adenylyltransferase [Candidatus Lokiarchaeia archaeon]|nr:pantetheine-phosphate adenylyltransferase [Candidatus Lokiarchaeia archaeon]